MILIAGASGLLGSNFALTCLAEGRPFHGTYHQHPLQDAAGAGGHFSRRDLSSAGEVEALIREVEPSLVVNCSAYTNVDSAETAEEQARTVNAELPELLARASRTSGAKFVHISTDGVFHGNGRPLSEDDAPEPLNAYARGKLEGEERVLAANPDALVIRTCIYGWNCIQKESLAEWITRNLREGRQITGFTDVTFNPLYVGHLAKLILKLVERKIAGRVHLGTRDAASKYEFACKIADGFGLDGGLIKSGRVAEMQLRARRPNYTVLNCARAEALLEEPMPSIGEGIAAMRGLADSRWYQQLKGWGERADGNV